ncbi:mechanosensitive ion channel family protein [Sphingomonas naphthae]|uniref:Mechanosensitive ion channel family protein n=1 Tax=Sphingomonas naphthae TaxID=1813468 RepID=A0ABY7TFT3_9SPHN|nr:mechanosensitive ion channel family protein [Sphingomonas naphthae]WCT72092.1 mechanosensitive ion channel family protein [Sphingomonas naphthae]
MTQSTTEDVLAKAAEEPLFKSPADVLILWDQSLDWLLHHWLQIAIAAGAGAVIVAALLGLKSLSKKLCVRKGAHGWPLILGKVVSRTSFFFMVMLAARLVSGYARPPEMVASTIEVVWTITAAVQAALWARELIIGIIEQRSGDHDGSTLGSAIGIIRLLVTVVLFAIATVVILDNLGVNVTGLIAGLGIGGIAIGLAAKGIFDDLFSALSIIFDKPFRRGDSIKWDGTAGTVEAIGLKTTRVRAVTGEEVVISNTNLLNKELHNMARLARRRNVLTIGVTYETPPDKLAEVPDLVRRIVEQEDKCKLVRCGIVNFGASSVDFELQFDVMSEVYDVVFNARHHVLLAILRAFNEEAIGIAYPTQVTYTAAPGGELVMPWPSEVVTRLPDGPAPAIDNAGAEPAR